MKVKKMLLIFVSVLIAITVSMIFVGCEEANVKTLDNNAKEVFSGIEETSLEGYVEQISVSSNADSYLKDNNITIEVVKAELAMSKDIIPFNSEVGGSPYIVMESVQLVGDQWLYCNAEDGHVSADLLVKFVVDDDGGIEFKACAMDMNGGGTYMIEESSEK